ncbi:MAG: hypothetical protein ACP5O4_07970, partial [bacterium]
MEIVDFENIFAKIVNKDILSTENEKKQYLKYIKYLAESSRRINKKFHFEKIFTPPKRPPKNKFAIFSFPDIKDFIDFIYTDNFRFQYINNVNKNMIPMVGFGLLKIREKLDISKNILYVGPIIYSRFTINYEEKKIEQIFFNELNLNYDIFSNLFNISEEDIENKEDIEEIKEDTKDEEDIEPHNKEIIEGVADIIKEEAETEYYE